MAFLPQTEKEKQDAQAAGQPGSAPTTSAVSGTVTPGQPGAQAVEGQPSGQAKGGTRFTNLRQYLAANQGNDGQMGQQVSRVVDQSAQQASSKLQNFQQTGAKEVQAGTVRDAGIVDAVRSAPEAVNRDAFTKQYNATYAGPAEASRVTGYQDAVQSTNQLRGKVQNAGGGMAERATLLREAYAAPGYKRGEQRFDSFLLGAGQQGQNALKDIQTRHGGAEDRLRQASDAVTSEIKQGQDLTRQTREATQKAYQETREATESRIKGAAESVTSQREKNEKDYKDLLAGLGSEDGATRGLAYQKLGLDAGTGEWLRQRGYDPAKLVSAVRQQTLGDVVSPEQVRRYEGLLGLLGESSGFDFTKAGGENRAFDVNRSGVQTAQEARQLEDTFQQALRQAQQDRDFQADRIRGGWNSFSEDERRASRQALGITDEDARFLEEQGIDPFQFYSKGRALQLGDVVKDEQRQRYGQLLGLLGVGGQDVADYGDEGAAFSLNRDALLKTMADRRAQLTAEAARNQPPPPPPPGPSIIPGDTDKPWAERRVEELENDPARGLAQILWDTHAYNPPVNQIKKPKWRR